MKLELAYNHDRQGGVRINLPKPGTPLKAVSARLPVTEMSQLQV